MLALNRWNGYKFQLQQRPYSFYTVKVVKGTAVGDTTIYDRDDEEPLYWIIHGYHVVVTYKSGEMSFYVNGDLVKIMGCDISNPVPVTHLPPTPIDFVIGQDLPTSTYLTADGDYQVAWGGFWTGDLDDVMFYNIALDGPQVKSIYNNQNSSIKF